MGHHNHQHIEPLVIQRKHAHGAIEANVYGALTGTFDHWTLSAHDGTHADDNHIYLWLNVESVLATGKYEVAINVESSKVVGDASRQTSWICVITFTMKRWSRTNGLPMGLLRMRR